MMSFPTASLAQSRCVVSVLALTNMYFVTVLRHETPKVKLQNIGFLSSLPFLCLEISFGLIILSWKDR